MRKSKTKQMAQEQRQKAFVKTDKYNAMFSFIHVSLDKISKALNFMPADLKYA